MRNVIPLCSHLPFSTPYSNKKDDCRCAGVENAIPPYSHAQFSTPCSSKQKDDNRCAGVGNVIPLYNHAQFSYMRNVTLLLCELCALLRQRSVHDFVPTSAQQLECLNCMKFLTWGVLSCREATFLAARRQSSAVERGYDCLRRQGRGALAHFVARKRLRQ